jgi:hypothetical protein
MLVRCGGSYVSLACANESFFLAEVHFNAPSPEIVLEEFFK